MSTIVTRAGKGSVLTFVEGDDNFTNLNTDKWEDSTVASATAKATPVNADLIPIIDSAAANVKKTLSWSNLKATFVNTANTWLATQTFTEYGETAPAPVNSSTAQTIVLSNGTVLSYTLTGNCTFTMPTATSGKSFVIRLTQDGTGGRTATFTGVKWPAGVAPTITTTATTGVDILSFVCIGSVWYGTAAQAFA